MRVSIIGSGYVGLVTGACLAELGHEVLCVDVDAGKVRSINAGIAPIRERGLDGLLKRHAGNRLRAVTDLRAAVLKTDLTLVAVGTPFDGHAIDLAQIKGAAAAIGRALRDKPDWHMVVIKSTVVPGTTEKEVLPILETESGRKVGPGVSQGEPGVSQAEPGVSQAEPGVPQSVSGNMDIRPGFGLGMNPEFLTEGEAVDDFLHPDRLVLGAIDAASLTAMEKLYRVFPETGQAGGIERIRTNCTTAEMIKYASNSLLATMISFSNEIANLCSAQGGVDAMDVVGALRTSQYLGGKPHPAAAQPSGPAPIADFLVPGCGFGGSCLPKDISALISHGHALGASMRVLEAVRDTNAAQPARIGRLLEKHFPKPGLRGLPVAVLGLAFRPGTSDLRESPAIPIIRDLLACGARVTAFDPAVSSGRESGDFASREADAIGALFDGAVRLVRSLEEAVSGARGIVLVTRWPEFSRLPELLERSGDPPVVVDGRRMLDRRLIARYEGIGL